MSPDQLEIGDAQPIGMWVGPRTQGKLDFTAAFSGPVKAPVLAGTASLQDTRFAVRGQDLAVRSLSGRADFSESRIIIQDVQGFLNDGRIRARGDARRSIVDDDDGSGAKERG